MGADARQMLIPHEGYVMNPLRTGRIRNEPCICGSGKKVKKCCGNSITMDKDMAEIVHAAVSGNEEMLKELLTEAEPTEQSNVN